jgi:hypothetical protein
MKSVSILDNIDSIYNFRDEVFYSEEFLDIDKDIKNIVDLMVIKIVFQIRDLLDGKINKLDFLTEYNEKDFLDKVPNSNKFLQSLNILSNSNIPELEEDRKIDISHKISQIIFRRFG